MQKTLSKMLKRRKKEVRGLPIGKCARNLKVLLQQVMIQELMSQ